MPRKGNIALLSQSGAMAVAITDWAYDENIGFSKVVSLGNKAGIDENSCLEYLANDKDTKVIMMYLESFVDGQKFMERAKKVVRNKPIIVFKSGTSEAGSAAVSSHTGALSGGDTAVETALRQSGVLRAHCIEDFFNLARLVSMQPIPQGNKIAVITNAGGPGVITTDAIDESPWLELAQFSSQTTAKLKKSLPETANTHNPVDIIGDALADRYEKSFDAVLADKNVDILFTILTPQIMTEKEDTARALIQYNAQYPQKTCVTSFIGGKNISYAAEKLGESNIPNFVFPKTAIHALEYMMFLKRWREKQTKQKPKIKHNSKSVRVRSHILNEIKHGKKSLSQKIVTELLNAYDIHVPEILLTRTEQKAVEFAEKIGYPVVLKISSDDVLHKTDSGGVRLDIQNEKELRNAYQEIIKNVKKNCKNCEIDGILVQKMYHFGREILIGMKRDPVFGPLVVFGLGGIYVEVMQDVAFRVAPVSMDDALEMINETKAIRLLKGVRGETPSDIKVLAETIVKISQLSIDIPEITEIDLNPMLVFEKGAVAIDGRVIL
jgi:acyl-CoA synthetase (NDP forming)